MIVHAPEIKKVLDDYDFTFTGGMVMPITVDIEAGDTINFGRSDGTITIRLAQKPMLSDPEKLLPAEDISIYKQHLVAFQHRVRIVTNLTPEQQHEWMKTLKEMSPTVN